MQQLEMEKFRRIVVLTGAGVSAASGIPTFRGAGGGLAEKLLPVSDGRRLMQQLVEHWQVYGELRAGALQVKPNAAHLALAVWQRKWAPGRQITLVTQNVDGLHQVAESPQVLEIHGSLRRTRCTNDRCQSEPFVDERVPVVNSLEDVPKCSLCEAPLRFDIVLFNEQLDLDAHHYTKKALRDCDLFLAIGTSGTVWPAADFVRGAKFAGARTVFINLTPLDEVNSPFDETVLGKAEEVLPGLLGE